MPPPADPWGGAGHGIIAASQRDLQLPARTRATVPPIDQLQRVPQLQLDRLERQGIFTTGLLLEVSETRTRRQTLADQVQASVNEVNAWRDEALLLNQIGRAHV